LRLRNRFEQRPAQQIILREDVAFYGVGRHGVAFVRADRQELALIVPFINGRVGVEALIALKANEPSFQRDCRRGGQGAPGLYGNQLAGSRRTSLASRQCPGKVAYRLLMLLVPDLGKVAGDLEHHSLMRCDLPRAFLPDAFIKVSDWGAQRAGDLK
jgi:hypothetical protein